MFKVYDYKCPSCNIIEEKFVRATEVDAQVHKSCGTLMERLLCSPHLDYDGMGNDPDFTTAWNKKGDTITKRHRGAGQYHTGATNQ